MTNECTGERYYFAVYFVVTQAGNVQAYPWNDQQLQILHSHKDYHRQMLRAIRDLERNGPQGQVLPQMPQTNLSSLLPSLRTEPTELLTGRKLHEYLVQHLRTYDVNQLPQINHNFESLERIVDVIKHGYELVKKQNSTSLAISIDFGQWLALTFELYKKDRRAGRVTIAWKTWLREHIGINESYARKLRQVTEILFEFPRFRQLGMSFLEVYRRRNDIKTMLITKPDIAQYWKIVP